MKINPQILSQKKGRLILLILLVFTSNLDLYCNDSLRLSREEFRYANNYRYTLLGDLPPKQTNLNLGKSIGIGVGVGALFTVQHIAQARTIWADESEFTVQEDGPYGLYVDKPGHFVSSYLASYVFGEAFFAMDFDERDAHLYGGILGWAYLNYIEIMDGFGENFGFSPTDVYFNTFGSAFYVLQHYFPYLQNITPKFTFFPADMHGEYRRDPHKFWVDDYSSQTFWLSFNIHNMLPENLKKFWPKWVELSFGYAARNLTDNPNRYDGKDVVASFYDWGEGSPKLGSPKYIVALDWNLMQILPGKGPDWLNWMRQTLNLFKWPSPAVEFSRDAPPRYFLTYPFPL